MMNSFYLYRRHEKVILARLHPQSTAENKARERIKGDSQI